MSEIEWAKELAIELHDDQIDDDGKPHWHHCQAVAEIVATVLPDDHELQTAAWLHDILEDTIMTESELRDEFDDAVVDLVVEVTKNDAGEFPDLQTERGVILKYADRLHNLSRMQVWSKSRRNKYKNKSRFWK